MRKKKEKNYKQLNKKEKEIELQKVVGTFQKNKEFGFIVPDNRKSTRIERIFI